MAGERARLHVDVVGQQQKPGTLFIHLLFKGFKERARLHVDVVGQQQKPGPFVSRAPAAKIAGSESYNVILHYIICYYYIIIQQPALVVICCGEALPASFIVR